MIIDLTIFWIRHDFSCANLLSSLGEVGIVSYDKNIYSNGKLVPDAKLTNKTIKSICTKKCTPHKNILDNNQIDLILCSESTRAIETALFLFRNKTPLTVYAAPFICEKRHPELNGSDIDNQPSNINEIKENIKLVNDIYNDTQTEIHKDCSRDGTLFLPIIDLSIIEQFRKLNQENFPADFKKFIEYVVPYILEHQNKYLSKKINILKSSHVTLNFVIISHQNFIKEVTSVQFIDNLDIVKQDLSINYKYDDIRQKNITEYKNKHAKNISKEKHSLAAQTEKKAIDKIYSYSIQKDAERCGIHATNKIIKDINTKNFVKINVNIEEASVIPDQLDLLHRHEDITISPLSDTDIPKPIDSLFKFKF